MERPSGRNNNVYGMDEYGDYNKPFAEIQDQWEDLENAIEKLDSDVRLIPDGDPDPDKLEILNQLKDDYDAEYEAAITFVGDCYDNALARIEEAKRQIYEGKVGASRKRAGHGNWEPSKSWVREFAESKKASFADEHLGEKDEPIRYGVTTLTKWKKGNKTPERTSINKDEIMRIYRTLSYNDGISFVVFNVDTGKKIY